MDYMHVCMSAYSRQQVITTPTTRACLTLLRFFSRFRGVAGGPTGSQRTPTSPTWRSRIWDVSPEGAAWDPGSPGEIARFKLVCLGRRHRTEKLVTESGLEISYVQARRDGRTRVRLCDIGH
jgi:hypothetical protein